MSRILLTGARAPATLHLARMFQAAGHRVFIADSCRFPISRFSRAVEKYFKMPPPVFQPTDFIRRLIEIIRQERIVCLIPTCEEIFHIANHLSRLQAACPDCVFWTENISRLLPLHDKGRFSQLIQDTDVPVPETVLIRSKYELEHCSLPPDTMVLKPVFSRFAAKTLIRPEAKALESLQFIDGQPWIAQRFIEGREFSSYSFAKKGQLLLHGSYFAPYRAGHGAGIYFEPLVHEGIRRFVERFSKQHQWTGHLAFDFIEDASGHLYVIECNPRLTSGIHLFNPMDGMDHILFNEGADNTVIPNSAPPIPIPMLSMMMAFYGLKQQPWRQFLTDFRRGRDVIFSERDPLPFVGQSLSLGEMAARSLAHQVSLLAATTRDIEWNGHEQSSY